MSPLARSLLALAAAAVLHAACADILRANVTRLDYHNDSHRGDGGGTRCAGDVDNNHCTSIRIGRIGPIAISMHKHIVEKLSIVNIDMACPVGFSTVGKSIVVCNPSGKPPHVKPLDGGKRALVTCSWTNWWLCPKGLDMEVIQYCDYGLHPQ